MMRLLIAWLLVGAAYIGSTAETKFDFSDTAVGESPNGFRSARWGLGEGPLGEWKVVLDAVPTLFPAFTAQGAAANRRAVLAQLSRSRMDEHYPLFIYEREVFGDFTFSTRCKMVEGVEEQMAGIIFRAKDERNFYYLRANAKDGNVRFYVVRDGKRSEPLGNNLPVASNQWHELKAECHGNTIRCFFNGKNVGDFTDNTFAEGKVGFWTKSDAVSYFSDARVIFTPKEILAQTIIRETMKRYSRLLGLRIYAVPAGKAEPEVIASTDPKDLGKPGAKAEKDILAKGTIYHDKGINDVAVLLPLHDRNGDVVAVARVQMRTFWGQTEQNAIARALPVVKAMESSIQTAKDLMH
jgi:hypothetical protein